MQQFYNPDLTSVVTPVNVNKLHELLVKSEYLATETQFLVSGFSEGFDIGYQGPQIQRNFSKNIPFTVGNNVILWNKIMKEVQAK